MMKGSRTRLVRRKRTRSAWQRERMALIRANALEGHARTRGLLEYTIRITKSVREPTILTNDIHVANISFTGLFFSPNTLCLCCTPCREVRRPVSEPVTHSPSCAKCCLTGCKSFDSVAANFYKYL